MYQKIYKSILLAGLITIFFVGLILPHFSYLYELIFLTSKLPTTNCMENICSKKLSFLQQYLLGCEFVITLSFAREFLFKLVKTILNNDVFHKNLKKLKLPEGTTTEERLEYFLIILFYRVFFSWISALVICWQTTIELYEKVSKEYKKEPDEYMALINPLRNYPKMSRECVWAYVQALEFKSGKHNICGSSELIRALESIERYYPDFDRIVALNILQSLHVINDEIIQLAIAVSKGRILIKTESEVLIVVKS